MEVQHYIKKVSVFVAILLLSVLPMSLMAQHDHSGHDHSKHNHDHSGHNHGKADHKHDHGKNTHAAGDHGHGHDDGHGHEDGELDIGGTIMGHIADANEFHIVGNLSLPLPVMLYKADGPDSGFKMFMSSKFEHGHKTVDGYNLDHHGKVERKDGGKYYDLSITKNVFSLLLSALILCLIFITAARGYKKNKGAPKGVQAFVEPLYMFVRDEIARPNLGSKYKKYMPFLCTVFFLIWANNFLGLVPFFPGSANLSGNIAFTMALALITFLIITFSANKHYWSHLINPPGVPLGVKFILVPIEILSIFIKPAALMIRLFANITAGHIIVLSLVCIIFIAGKLGGLGAGLGSSLIMVPFLLFMNVLELFVGALQAFVFTILSAVFIGEAVSDHGHEEHGAH